MGRRGPPPTPTALLRARGSWRAGARAGEPEPAGELERPGWLEGRAAAIWDRIAAILSRMQVVGSSDSGALARYCFLLSQWEELAGEVQAEGAMVREEYRDSRGRYRKRPLARNPRLLLMLEIEGQIGRLEKEFGLTPAARTLVRADTGKVPKSHSGMLRLA